MAKRLIAFGAAVGFCVAVLSGCGSSSNTPASGLAPLVVTVGDVPLCNLVSFRSIVNGLTLTPESGGSAVEVISANQTAPVDFASLRDTSAILDIGTVAPGTYSKATITLIASTMSVFDPSLNPPISVITPALTSETVTFNISPPLVVPPCPINSVNPCSAGALQIDFNLAQSIPLDAQGQIVTTGAPGSLSAAVTAVLTGTALTASGSEGFGELDDIHGYILSVNNTPTTSGTTNFIGSFVLQTLPGNLAQSSLSGAGPSLTVNLKSADALIGAPPALNQLTTGNFVQVDGYVDPYGSFVANSVVVEDQSDITHQIAAFVGPILSVDKDAGGHVTSLTMSVTDELPNTTAGGIGNAVAFDTPSLTVNISSSTGYHFSAPGVNYAGLTPDSTDFAVGQRIIAHGTYVPPATTNGATTLAANNIYIPLQTLTGKYVSLLAAGSDNLTGGFVFVPCSGSFQGQRIYVITSGVGVPNQPGPPTATQFINLNGLAGLTPAPQLQVRGLLFFDQAGGAIGGIQAPPNTYVLMANKVHQI